MKVLVTGAAGFVGRALVASLADEERFHVRAAVRCQLGKLRAAVELVLVGDITPDTDWRSALEGVDTVVHLAARAHVMREDCADPLAVFRRVNVAGTLNLARQAAMARVRRFVLLSSVKVNGEGNPVGHTTSRSGRWEGAYHESDPPAPVEAYAISKYEAELALHQIAANTAMEATIIRPPLVYGPGVRANFGALMRAVELGIPLPLGMIWNRRSLVAMDNLVDFIRTCIEHPAAADETFLVSDGEDLSTTELIRRLARAMGRPARLIPVPPGVLMAGAKLLGHRGVAQRLLGSLQVDISRARTLLDWIPPISVDEGLRRTVANS